MTWTDAAVGLAILIGVVGIIVPVLPGSLLILAALVAWALEVGGTTAWTVAGIAIAVLVVGNVVGPPARTQAQADRADPHVACRCTRSARRLLRHPRRRMFVGFPLGVYLAERVRVGPALAGASTKQALRAVGASILIELAAALLAAAVWVVGVVLT